MSVPETVKAITKMGTDGFMLSTAFKAGTHLLRSARLSNISTDECLAQICKEVGCEVTKNAKVMIKTFDKAKSSLVQPGVSLDKLGMVWEHIKPIQPDYPSTKIPKSFELHLENGKFWVHPNATKHMKEFFKYSATHGMPIGCQSILSDFANTIHEVMKVGFKYDTIFTLGKWELKIGAVKKTGMLPTIYHALYNP